MRITGTLHSIGHHQILTDGNPDDDETIEDRLERFTGILITADEATLRAASNLLYCTVDIYPHPVNELINGECTPENYAHAMARLAHAEASSPTADHLAREVRSSQALLARVKELEQAEKARADRDIESMRKREEYANEREAAWCKYLDLRKQARRLADDHKAQEPLLVEAFGIAKRYDFDIDRMELADAKKSIAALEAQHTALLAKQAEQERLLSIYRTKYHEADRARMKAMVDLIGYKEAVDLLAQCTPPGMFVRETAVGWRLTTDDTVTLHDSESAALKEAWTIYRAAQDDDESTLGTVQTPTPMFDDEGNET